MSSSNILLPLLPDQPTDRVTRTAGLQVTLAIDCFRCTSRNGDNPACEDPFHNNYSTSLYHAPCWSGRKDRDGVSPEALFPLSLSLSRESLSRLAIPLAVCLLPLLRPSFPSLPVLPGSFELHSSTND